jgi:hypothetical protein
VAKFSDPSAKAFGRRAEATTLLHQGYGGFSSPSSPQQATGYVAKENRYDERADSQNITQDFSPLQGKAKLVNLVCLVDLVHLVSFGQPNKRDKPNKPN